MTATEMRLASLVAAIYALPTKEPATGQAHRADLADVQRIFDELEAALAASDVKANQIVDASAVALRAALGDAYEPLRRPIADYLYPQALEILRRARKS